MLYREKDVESALFHLVSYMIKYGKEHNRKGQPLTFLLPVPGSGCLLCFLYLAHSGPPPKKNNKQNTKPWLLQRLPLELPVTLEKISLISPTLPPLTTHTPLQPRRQITENPTVMAK